MSDNSISRRKFVAGSAIALGGLITMDLPLFGQTVSASNGVNIGIVGTGKRGLGLINTIGQIPGLNIVACCDIIPENLSAAISKAGSKAKAYTDYEKFLANKSIDAVIISTPLYEHYPMAVAALSAKKHVYSEKSMAFTIAQSLDLVKRVRASGLVYQVGFQYRNYPLYHKVKQAIDEGWIGDNYSIECQYNRNSDWRYPVSDPKLERIINWRLYNDLCGGPLSELCAHQIDMVGYLTGSQPTKAIGIGGIDRKDGRTTQDNVRTIYEYQNGVKATYTSLLGNAFNGYQIKILGNDATIEIGRNNAYIYGESKKNALGTVDGVTGATITNATQGKKVLIDYLKPGEKDVEPTINALNNFLDCVVNNKKPVSNVDTGRDSAIAICMGLNAMSTSEMQYWKPEYSI
ncbi:Gfo/Idh/MocA family protein [Pedobacter arcticus]|uniref:Gfo/Idh/MocA family protein n=1 Tax=Pedobacter arcticus TaxID=752140 RepID=UPI000303E46E|nr:Gfo/Idh/MocA family oxidoreductase [Pedobacter arcticus]